MPKVVITDFAIRRIRKIHSYYSKKASRRTADKILNEIFLSISFLESHPSAWQEEEFLKKMRKGHRRITAGNYKIIYRAIGEEIFVTDVFDARRHPGKMKS